MVITGQNRVFIFESLSHLRSSGGHLYNIDCLNTNDPDTNYEFTFNLNDDKTIGYSCLDVDFVPDNIYYDEIGGARALNNILQTVIYDPARKNLSAKEYG